jgi:phenylacetate-CoA ligase
MINKNIKYFLQRPYYFLRKSPQFNYWLELEKTQYLQKDELVERQWSRFKSLLSYTFENNEYYRERYREKRIRPEDIKSATDIKQLPVISKEEIRDNTKSMITKGYDSTKLLKFKTGGSTGKPLEIYLTDKCSEMRNACARRHDRWTGWDIGEPIGAVWGNPNRPSGIQRILDKYLLTSSITLDTMNVNEITVTKFARDWKQMKPTLLYGHAHSLFILSEYLTKMGIEEIKPKGILSTSMMLIPHERRFIEKTFNIKVTDRYGCEEVSLIASECEHHCGMHLNVEHLFVEFIKEDGSNASPGETGRIIVTDLMNRAMPFIRYQVEDLGIPSNRTCPCGRGLPLMDKVTGRVADFLIKTDGSKVAGISLIENTLTRFKGLRQMQIIQNDRQKIVIRIVPDIQIANIVVDEMIKYFKKIFGDTINIQIDTVEIILPELTGKFRFAICNI